MRQFFGNAEIVAFSVLPRLARRPCCRQLAPIASVVLVSLFLTQCAGPGSFDEQRSAEPIRDALWQDATAKFLPKTSEWSHRVEAADLDADGDIDLLFANGGDYSTPGAPELNRVFLNQGPGVLFTEATEEVFGPEPDHARAIKVRDLNSDGLPDIVVACAYGTPSRLYFGSDAGSFIEVSSTHLPVPTPTEFPEGWSFGDVEVGDVDDDGDLDLVLVDWGPGDAMTNDGGSPRLWINQLAQTGEARFIDRTEDQLPALRLQFSWDLQLYDTDNDFDLDIVVSCKLCGGGALLRADGTGYFTRDRRALPQYTNNYDYAGMDLNGDGAIDLVTVNDGDIAGGPYSRREHVLINMPATDDGRPQSYRDNTATLWGPAANVGEDDNAVVFLDFDSDGDADFLLASLSGPDRLLINDGSGVLSLSSTVFAGEDTPGTLGIALADLDGDHRLDVIMSQGEHDTAIDERIFLGVGLPVDTAGPTIGEPSIDRQGEQLRVRVRIHDRKSPVQIEDFNKVELRVTGSSPIPLVWYGGQLWRSPWTDVPVGSSLEVCAQDRAGNEVCREASA